MVRWEKGIGIFKERGYSRKMTHGPCKICAEKSDEIRDILRPFGWSAFEPISGIRLLVRRIRELEAGEEPHSKSCTVLQGHDYNADGVCVRGCGIPEGKFVWGLQQRIAYLESQAGNSFISGAESNLVEKEKEIASLTERLTEMTRERDQWRTACQATVSGDYRVLKHLKAIALNHAESARSDVVAAIQILEESASGGKYLTDLAATQAALEQARVLLREIAFAVPTCTQIGAERVVHIDEVFRMKWAAAKALTSLPTLSLPTLGTNSVPPVTEPVAEPVLHRCPIGGCDYVTYDWENFVGHRLIDHDK